MINKNGVLIMNDLPDLNKSEWNEIIPPVDNKLMDEELNHSILLGKTKDDFDVYLVDSLECPNIMREISRLREVTFRIVREGTGKSADTDKYDDYYKHMVLWNEDEKEIIGAYRIGKTKEILKKYGKKGLVTARKFEINENFDEILEQSMEVGRAFIQQKYWNSQALDYMWQGIGAYILKNDDIRYLWGTISMSDEMPEEAKDLISFYYLKWYRGDASLAVPIHKYEISNERIQKLNKIFDSGDIKKDFLVLKKRITELGYTIPVLYRKYTDITNYGGTKFVNFCIDVNFKNSLDGFIVVDLTMLKEEVKKRYYSQKSFV